MTTESKKVRPLGDGEPIGPSVLSAAFTANLRQQTKTLESKKVKHSAKRTSFDFDVCNLLDTAKQGNVVNQFVLGWCYDFGEGLLHKEGMFGLYKLEEDKAKAAEWYQCAAQKGYAPAENNLGVCYDNGEGVPEDKAKAVEWYERAAKQEDGFAETNLGLCYSYGVGVTQDDEKAVFYYKCAAEKGLATALLNLGWCYENGIGVPKNEEKAVRRYLNVSTRVKDPVVHYNLGRCYENGIGVFQSNANAISSYRIAASQGDTCAQAQLEKLQMSRVTSVPLPVSGNANSTLTSPFASALFAINAQKQMPLARSTAQEHNKHLLQEHNQNKKGVNSTLTSPSASALFAVNARRQMPLAEAQPKQQVLLARSTTQEHNKRLLQEHNQNKKN